MSYKEIDINAWSRKAHFQFFKTFEEPFFGVTVDIDCTMAYQKAKNSGVSFFLFYLHKALQSANQTEPFKFRILNDKVIVHDKINAASTINRPDGTFGFSNIEFFPEFKTFEFHAEKVIEQVRNSTELIPSSESGNVIHFSALPWIKFTSVSHARNFSVNDSCPKISFGKVTESNGKKVMPLSVHVHHALMDGYHLGVFVEAFQELMNASDIR